MKQSLLRKTIPFILNTTRSFFKQDISTQLNDQTVDNNHTIEPTLKAIDNIYKCIYNIKA
jgi:hypothetical protein